jgi:transcriptional regulator with XRE-family HTH domain
METLSAYIKRQAITQSDLADKLGISPTTISLILSGARQPGIALTKKIESVTGIPRHQLRPDVYEAAQ